MMDKVNRDAKPSNFNEHKADHTDDQHSNQGNNFLEQDSRQTFGKKRKRVELDDSEEEEGKQTPSRKKRGKENAREKSVIPMPVSEVAPEMPEEIKDKIRELNGVNVKWLTTKRLFKSDVSAVINRFSMPSNQIKNSFLRDDERERLAKREGIEVRLVGPTGELSKKVLKSWAIKRDNDGKVIITYYLISGWYKDIVQVNGLQNDQLVHVWSFREGTKLSFALVKVDIM